MQLYPYFSGCRRTGRALKTFFSAGLFLLLAAVTVGFTLWGCAGVTSSTSPAPGTYSISGTITPASMGSGATVNLSGQKSASTTGDSSGNYSFTGLVNGNYTVTPSRTGYVFAPSVEPVTINGANATQINFTASQQSSHTVALAWNGDVLDEKWKTPKIAGMVIDFSLNAFPGMRRSLIVLERKKTDWLAFLRSRSQVRAYDLDALIAGTVGAIGRGRSED